MLLDQNPLLYFTDTKFKKSQTFLGMNIMVSKKTITKI